MLPYKLAPILLATIASPSLAVVATGLSKECRVAYSHFLGQNATVYFFEDHKDSTPDWGPIAQSFIHADSQLGGSCSTAANQNAAPDTTVALHITGSNGVEADTTTNEPTIVEAVAESYMYFTFQVFEPALYIVSGTNTDSDTANQLGIYSVDNHGYIYLSNFDGGTLYNETAPILPGTYQLKIYSKIVINGNAFDANVQSFNFAVVPLPEPASLSLLTLLAPLALRRRRP